MEARQGHSGMTKRFAIGSPVGLYGENNIPVAEKT
jgi:hypothetical protein